MAGTQPWRMALGPDPGPADPESPGGGGKRKETHSIRRYPGSRLVRRGPGDHIRQRGGGGNRSFLSDRPDPGIPGAGGGIGCHIGVVCHDRLSSAKCENHRQRKRNGRAVGECPYYRDSDNIRPCKKATAHTVLDCFDRVFVGFEPVFTQN